MMQLRKIKETVKANSQVLESFSWLTVLQFANYLIPLVIIPYVMGIVGVELFGRVTYAQNITAYLTVLVNFGFEYSATQEIAIHRGNEEKVRAIYWSVIRVKIGLLFLSFAILWALSFNFVKVEEDKLLYFYAALINVGFTFFPSWFFQGMEKMARMTILNFGIKVLGALLIILFVRQASDYRLYLLLLSLSFVVGGIVSSWYVVRRFDLSYTSQRESGMVKKGFPIFLNNVFSTIYSAVGLTILGVSVSEYLLGIYSGAYKILVAVLMFVTVPITLALFPVMSRKFNESFEMGLRFYKKTFVLVTVFGVVVSLGLFIFSDFIVRLLLGNDLLPAVSVLRTMAVIPLLVIVASMLTVQGMYGLQLQRYAPYIGGAICVVSLLLNYWLINRHGIMGAAWAYIVVEVMEIVLVASVLMYHYKKNKR